jgi:hypothetical protein
MQPPGKLAVPEFLSPRVLALSICPVFGSKKERRSPVIVSSGVKIGVQTRSTFSGCV